MNLTQTVFLLSDEAEEFLCVLYRQSKIRNNVNLNVLAVVTGLSAQHAHSTAEKLHALGLIRYGKYGSVSLTPDGAAYEKTLLRQKP